MNVKELLNKIKPGIRSYALRKVKDPALTKDLIQEGMLKAFEVIKKYQNKPEKELLKLMARSAYNKINTMLINEINWINRNLIHTVKKEESDKWDKKKLLPIDTIGIEDRNYEIIAEMNFIKALEFYLKIRERKILREKLNPSVQTIKVYEKELKEKQIKISKGIQNIHISKSLNVSEATVCRDFKHIRKVAVFLKNN